jgi:chitinase
MRYGRWALLLLCLVLGLAVNAQDETAPKRIVGYFTSWGIYGREYFVTDIPADKLTHINYAFANLSDEGECLIGDSWADIEIAFEGDPEDAPFKGNFRQLNLLKEKNPNLKTLISIGGWTWSRLFSDVAMTEESREKFAASCVKFMKDYGFDGLDVDWEYPTGGGNTGNHESPDDPENFILLMEELREQLDAAGEADGTHYLLTIAASSRATGIDWERVHPLLDWINVMAYDFSGGWSAVTGFNAPLFDSTDTPPESGSADTSLQAYLEAGVPADKLVLGLPFYGKGWKGVPAENNGLHQAFDDVTENYLPTMTRFWDENARVPWLYNEETGLMITYEDVESATAKAEYVNENGFGGVMFWEISADSDDAQLLSALWDTLMETEE